MKHHLDECVDARLLLPGQDEVLRIFQPTSFIPRTRLHTSSNEAYKLGPIALDWLLEHLHHPFYTNSHYYMDWACGATEWNVRWMAYPMCGHQTFKFCLASHIINRGRLVVIESISHIYLNFQLSQLILDPNTTAEKSRQSNDEYRDQCISPNYTWGESGKVIVNHLHPTAALLLN